MSYYKTGVLTPISWYYNNRKNPPIHYIVFATPHKKKYLLQKRQLWLSFLLYGCNLEMHRIK